MTKWNAIAVYRCTVAGKPTASLDFTIRRIEANNITEVEELLFSEANVIYQNEDDESVEWHLSSVPSIQEDFENPDDDELAGFIADLSEIEKWAKPRA